MYFVVFVSCLLKSYGIHMQSTRNKIPYSGGGGVLEKLSFYNDLCKECTHTMATAGVIRTCVFAILFLLFHGEGGGITWWGGRGGGGGGLIRSYRASYFD